MTEYSWIRTDIHDVMIMTDWLSIWEIEVTAHTVLIDAIFISNNIYVLNNIIWLLNQH